MGWASSNVRRASTRSASSSKTPNCRAWMRWSSKRSVAARTGQPDHREEPGPGWAAVGEGVVRICGIAENIYRPKTANVNVRVINQGASEMNIIIGVDSADYEKAARFFTEPLSGKQREAHLFVSRTGAAGRRFLLPLPFPGKPTLCCVKEADIGTVEATVAQHPGRLGESQMAGQVGPAVGGRIATLNVRKGDEVKAGQLLLALWNMNLEADQPTGRRSPRPARWRTAPARRLPGGRRRGRPN